VTQAQVTTAVQSGVQNQTNVSSYVSLPTIASVIRQTFTGAGGLRNADNGTLEFDHRGIAASADGALPMQAWAQGNGGHSQNDLTTGGYSLDNYGSQVGFQVQVAAPVVLGVSASWQGMSGKLNGGFTSNNSTLGLSPYIGWQFDEHWSVSAIAGYNSGSTRLNNSGVNDTARYSGYQWDLLGEIDGSYTVGDFRLSPLVSLAHIETTSYGFTDTLGNRTPRSTTALTRGSLGGSASLPMTGWEPYVRLSGEHDFEVPTGSAPNGDSGATIGIGTTITVTPAIWVTIDGGYNSLGRTGLSLWSGSARLDLRF
jgi:outer membrane autotransporter protein